MGMLIKSTIAGLTLGTAAFGGVYYGLPDQAPTTGVEPSPVVRTEPIAPRTQDRRTADVKVAEVHPHPERKEKAAQKIKPKKQLTPATEIPPDSEQVKKIKKKWLDRYLKAETDEDTKSSADYYVPKTKATADDDKSDKKDDKKSADKMPDYHKAHEDKAKDKGNDKDMPAYHKAHADKEKSKDMPAYHKAHADKSKDKDKAMPSYHKADPATYKGDAKITIVMQQAKNIESSDLRDQAYMDVVTYALIQPDYYAARKAMARIERAELRETARSQIAVAYAYNGEPTAAFHMVDTVELDDFKDVMRLQVIEALIGTKKTPDVY